MSCDFNDRKGFLTAQNQILLFIFFVIADIQYLHWFILQKNNPLGNEIKFLTSYKILKFPI